MEEDLRNDGDATPQVVESDLLGVDSVHCNLSKRLRQSEQDRYKGRLAGSSPTNDTNLAGAGGETRMPQSLYCTKQNVCLTFSEGLMEKERFLRTRGRSGE